MDKAKLFNLFVLAFAISLTIQVFFLPKKDTTIAAPGINMSIEDDSITIPNIPKISLQNTGTGSVKILPCESVSIKIDSIGSVNNIATDAPAFCQEMAIDAGGTSVLPMESLYRLFASTAGKYIVTLNHE